MNPPAEAGSDTAPSERTVSIAELLDEHEALIQFLYMAPIGIAQMRSDGALMLVNPLCAQLLMPLSRDGALDNLFDALESVAPDLRSMARAFTASHGLVCEAMQLHLNAGVPGKRDPKILSLTLLKLDGERMMAVLNDVTAAVKRERQLKQSDAWFNAIVTGVTDYALMAVDADGAVEAWNRSVGRVTGFASQAVEGSSYSMFYPPGSITREQVRDRLHEADQNGWSLDEGWRLRADGSRYWGSCLIAPLGIDMQAPTANVQSTGYSLILRDITDRRESNEALRRAVSCDHLTGLSNRRAFFESAELEMQRWQRSPRPLSVIVFDADHFKSVNDRYGHAAGDAVLRHFAVILSVSFRDVDVVARVGGEEFVVLLPGTDRQDAAMVAQRLVRQVSAQTVEVDGSLIRYTVSAGIASMDDGTSNLDSLMKRADAALYAAKARGRNRAECWCGEAPVSAATPAPTA